jgi:hypothetical protein
VLFGHFLQFLSRELEPILQDGLVNPCDPARIGQSDRTRTESTVKSAQSRRDRPGSRPAGDVAPTLRRQVPRDARHR